MARSDELEEYLAGDSEVSRAYRSLSTPSPPASLERRVLGAGAPRRPTRRGLLLACAACAFFCCIGLTLFLLRAPSLRADDAPRITRVHFYREPRAEDTLRHEQAAWIARIVALRREGRNDEADAELKRFRSAFPDHTLPSQQ